MATDNRYRKKLGAWGETLASDYLSKKGYTLLERNYHTRFGEIDLIMKTGDQLVAIEVKTRKSSSYGIAEDSITRKKYQAIQAAMFVYFENHAELDPVWQLDIMVIDTDSTGNPAIIHYENIYLDYLNE
jgi:putative endonuclease